MEDLMRELIQVIQESNNTWDWNATLNTAMQAVSIIAIIVLLIERQEKKRPYLQISFDPIRSSLACIVIKNVGEVPAKLSSISCNDEFINQFPISVQTRFQKRDETDIIIFPGQKWVLSLDVITGTIMKFKQQNAVFKISYSYSSASKNIRKTYDEDTVINFKEFAGFLIYISEVDELRKEIESISKQFGTLIKVISEKNSSQKSEKQLTSLSSYDDEWERRLPVSDDTTESPHI